MDSAMSDRLCSVPLFAALEHDHLASVANLVEEFDSPAGLVLVHPGMVGAGLFIIEEGMAVLTIRDRNIELGPGEIIGELALLDDRSVHVARVVTKTQVSGYCISRDNFIELLHEEPKIAIPMLHVLAHRLVDMLSHH